jgi:molecular chaperone DnaK
MQHHQRADRGGARFRPRQEGGDRKIAVYDLGGGTRHFHHRNRRGGRRAPVRGALTNGDTFLGGEDFDQRLIDYVVTEFKRDQGVDLNDVLALQRLKARREGEDRLSSSQQTEINLPTSRRTNRGRSTRR